MNATTQSVPHSAAPFEPQAEAKKISAVVYLATNRPLLEDLATRSGGQVFEPEDATQLVERLKKAIATRQNRVETRLGRSAWTLILFLLLLSTEWVVRKFVGLP